MAGEDGSDHAHNHRNAVFQVNVCLCSLYRSNVGGATAPSLPSPLSLVHSLHDITPVRLRPQPRGAPCEAKRAQGRRAGQRAAVADTELGQHGVVRVRSTARCWQRSKRLFVFQCNAFVVMSLQKVFLDRGRSPLCRPSVRGVKEGVRGAREVSAGHSVHYRLLIKEKGECLISHRL